MVILVVVSRLREGFGEPSRGSKSVGWSSVVSHQSGNPAGGFVTEDCRLSTED